VIERARFRFQSLVNWKRGFPISEISRRLKIPKNSAQLILDNLNQADSYKRIRIWQISLWFAVAESEQERDRKP
jgi:hypothetical protein